MIEQAKSQDVQQLANLIHFDSFVHRHLDYRPPLDWVGDYPFNVLVVNEKIQAALACPPDPPHVAWIRLFAAAHHIQVTQAWDQLWQTSLSQLRIKSEVKWVAAIPLQTWFSRLLIKEKFELTHDILMLSWDGAALPAPSQHPSIHIRPMTLDDIDKVTQIDSDSFSPLWQISNEYLRIAYYQANIATVAEFEGKVSGFQISTATSVGGHLARLAVSPNLQGRGIAYALLHDLVHQFKRRGALSITVNTQENNHASLALYKKAGFMFTGEKYPVYELAI
jgi:ribosomal-protein-alanine N-acetyltransferase